MLAALNKDSSITVQSSLSSPATHVPHRFIHSNRKTGPPRSTPYEACTVPLEEQLEGTRITTKGDPPTQVALPHLKWWLEESNMFSCQPLHPLKQTLQIFTDA